MSAVCSHAVDQSRLPNSYRDLPGDYLINDDSTLDDFVRIVLLKEKSRQKRQALPALAPCETNDPAPSSLLRRVQRSLFCA